MSLTARIIVNKVLAGPIVFNTRELSMNAFDRTQTVAVDTGSRPAGTYPTQQQPLAGLSREGNEPALPRGPAPKARGMRETQEAHEALRRLLMDVFLEEDPVQSLMTLTPFVPQSRRVAWHLVVHTLLARRLDACAPAWAGHHPADAHTLAWTLQRQWDQPALAQRWERLVSGWSARQCRQLVARARGLARAPQRSQASPAQIHLH